MLLLFTLQTNASTEISFGDLGIGEISVPGLRVVTVEANFTSEITGRVVITAIIYADVGNSTITMKITINNISEYLFLDQGKNEETWIQNVNEKNHVEIMVSNLGTYKATIYSNSTIRITIEEPENPFLPKPQTSYYWYVLLTAAYVSPFIITLVYRKKVEGEGEEEIPVIVG